MPTKVKLLITTVLIISAVSCKHRSDVIPIAPDYADITQWYIADRGAAVDVFYIVSTECDDYTLGGKPMHYADTRNDIHIPCPAAGCSARGVVWRP